MAIRLDDHFDVQQIEISCTLGIMTLDVYAVRPEYLLCVFVCALLVSLQLAQKNKRHGEYASKLRLQFAQKVRSQYC